MSAIYDWKKNKFSLKLMSFDGGHWLALGHISLSIKENDNVKIMCTL